MHSVCRIPRILLSCSLAVVLATSSLALAGKPADVDPLPLPADGRVGVIDKPIDIRLQHGHFDPARVLPPLPPSLISRDRQPEGPAYYLVQLDGPIRQATRARLEAAGASIMDYVPDFAYIVRMDSRGVENARAIAGMRWIGIYEPGFRLSSELMGHALFSSPDADALPLIVRAFRNEPAQQVAAQLSGLGVHVKNAFADAGGGAIFEVVATPDQLFDMSGIMAVAWIERELEPALANSVARSNTIMRQDAVEGTLGLYGSGQVVAIGDSGLDTGDPATIHQDFADRVIGGTWGPGNCGTWADNNSHGTHVAGSSAGSGALSGADIPGQDYSGSHAGIAPEAELFIWSFCNNFSGLPQAAPYADYYGALYASNSRLRVNNNSWGYTSNFGEYNTFTRETDRFVADFPDMVLVYAAGNDGRDGNSDGVVDSTSINMPSTAKNVISVGASENLRDTGGYNPGGACSTWGNCWSADYPADPINSDRISDDEYGIAAFSGRGPTLSNRIKPDVVAPGTNIVSARNYSSGSGWGVYNADYLYMGGTSMASPLVAGAAAVVREFYEVHHGVTTPSAALVKATLINGAVDMTPGQYGGEPTQEVLRRPDRSQGFGRVHMEDSLVYVNDRELYFHEHAGLETDDSFQIVFHTSAGGAPFRATLAWSDREGTEAAHGALVNDLDLEVLTPGGALHPGNVTLTGGPADRDNNVEVLELPGEDGEFTITVRGFNVPQGPQPFALVVSYQATTDPRGDLEGMVESSGNLLADATISAAGPFSRATLSDTTGEYNMKLDVGSYDVTASRFRFVSQTVNNIQIDEDETVQLNFDLAPASAVLLEGTVSDAQTGWPLYARIDVNDDPDGPYWSDPETGTYSFSVPSDTVFSLTVTSLVPGYAPDSFDAGPLTADEVIDVQLFADSESCTAPGHAFDGQVNGDCQPPATGGLIVGQVFDSEVNEINGASIDHEDGPTATSAMVGGPDGDAFYAVFSPAGEWELEASAQGYDTSLTTVEVTSGETVRHDFVLSEPNPPVLVEYCTEPNLAIPDNNPAGVDSIVNVPDNAQLIGVSAYVRGLHTWVGDLRVRLTHPDGATSVLMIDRPGIPPSDFGCGNDDFDVWLDDFGTDGPVEDQCFTPPALRGHAMPNEPMSAFNDLSAQGNWTLNISDNAADDTGTLHEWCLELGLPSYRIGGTVAGLSGSGLVLQNNGGDDLDIEANGSFSFATTLPDGAAYDVTVLTDPASPNQSCSVTNGSNTVDGEDVINIGVNCVTHQFSIGGNVTGLEGSGLVLQNNNDDDLPITVDGSFTFGNALDDGSSYDVTVLSQPEAPDQFCLVGNGTGTLSGDNVDDIVVDCVLDLMFHDRFEMPPLP